MNQTIIDDGATRYTRISKRRARKLHANGQGIYIIAHKMRPGFPFSLGMLVPSVERISEEVTPTSFDDCVRNFEWYNANCYETGYYSAFYTMSAL